MSATGRDGEHVAEKNYVALESIVEEEQLRFVWGNDQKLHEHGDCLKVKIAAGNVGVFFPVLPSGTEAVPEEYVTGTVDILEDRDVNAVKWGLDVRGTPITSGRLTISYESLEIPDGDGNSTLKMDGFLLSYSGMQVGDIVTMQIIDMHLVNPDGVIKYSHGDPNVVFKPVNNPKDDKSDFPPCPPKA